MTLLAFAAEHCAVVPLLVGARHLLLTIDVSCLRGAQQRTRRTPLLRLNDGRQTVTYRPCFSCYASSVNKFSDHGITLPAAAFWRWRHVFRSIFGTRGTNSYRLHLSSDRDRTVSGIWLASATHSLAAANQLHVDRRWLCAQSQARRKEMKWGGCNPFPHKMKRNWIKQITIKHWEVDLIFILYFTYLGGGCVCTQRSPAAYGPESITHWSLWQKMV